MIKLAPAALKADLQVRQERVRIAMEEEGVTVDHAKNDF